MKIKPLYLPLAFLISTIFAFNSAIAAPSNDNFANAQVISALPYNDAVVTADATPESNDPDCIGNGPTVWYAFTPSTDMYINANTVGSDYDTTLSVYTGTSGSLSQIACNDDSIGLQSKVLLQLSAGETYYFMVGAFASGSGGNLQFHIAESFPATVTNSLDSSIKINNSGTVATVNMATLCTSQANVNLQLTLSQNIGRLNTIRGVLDKIFYCISNVDNTLQVNANGKFRPGPMALKITGQYFDLHTDEWISLPQQTIAGRVKFNKK